MGRQVIHVIGIHDFSIARLKPTLSRTSGLAVPEQKPGHSTPRQTELDEKEDMCL